MSNTSITIRMDEKLKKQAEAIFHEMGMNMTTAFTIFTKTVVRKGKIPFEISVDPFWSEENQTRLMETIAEHESDKTKIMAKTMKELEAMANE
jgi:DNA-damage-inducible protein J